MKNTFLITTLLATTALATNAVADVNCYDCMTASNCPENSGCQSQNNGHGTVYYKVETVGTGESQTKHMTIYGPTEGYAREVPEKAFYITNHGSTFPEDVTSLSFSGKISDIGVEAFRRAPNLHNVDLSGVVAATHSYFFQDTPLQNVVLSDSFFKSDGTLQRSAYQAPNHIGLDRQVFMYTYPLPTVYCPRDKDCSGFFCGNGCDSLQDVPIVSFMRDEIGTGVYIVGNEEPYSYYMSASNIPNTPCNDLKSCQVASLQAQGDKCTTQTECSNLIDMVSDSNYDCNSITTCSAFAKDSANNINLASLYGAPAGGNGGTGGTGGSSEQAVPKRIYTVEEARQAVEAAGTETVNFRIRYK